MRQFLLCLTFSLVAGARVSAAAQNDDMRPDRAEIARLLQAGDFQKIDQILGGFEDKFEADHSKRSWPTYAFGYFDRSDPMLEPALSKWVHSMPDAYTAHLARGIFLSHVAYLSRGDKVVPETPASRLGEMTDFAAAAAEDLERATAIHPELPVAYAYLQDLALHLGQHAAAKHYIDTALAIDPGSPVLQWDYLHMLEPKWGGSLREIESYLGAHTKDFTSDKKLEGLAGFEDYVRADMAMTREEYDAAATLADRALQRDEQDVMYLELRALIEIRDARSAEAIPYLNRAIERAPENPALYYFLATARAELGMVSEAIPIITKAIDYDRLNPDYLRLRAGLYAGKGMHADAVRDLDDAVTYGVYDLDVELDRARELLKFKARTPDAVAAARLAIKLAPRSGLAWIHYAQALLDNQDCDAKQALKTFYAVCGEDSSCDAVKRFIAPMIIPGMMCPT